MDLKKIIEETLNIPVLEPFRPVIPPCSTYYPISDESGLVGDGDEIEEIERYQVDIWNRERESIKQMAKLLKSALVSSGGSIPHISYYYDNNGKVWRATMTFSYVGEE